MGFEYSVRNIINIVLQINHEFNRPLKSGREASLSTFGL